LALLISTDIQQLDKRARTEKLRDGWRMVRFDQMAESISDRVDKPSESNVAYYVGLEHLDPESLKIHRWGTPDDVEATKLRFKPGDIIFGRRRAYQRKVAVAEFEGICSAHALVLRAREETVLKEFLPFFMQSDTFFERALAISVGSLSPTINWKTLAQQEFLIPPKDEQRRIADILWAFDNYLCSTQTVIDELVNTKQALLIKLFSEYQILAESKLSNLGEIGEWQTGSTPSKQILHYWENGEIPWITPKDVKYEFIEDTEDHITLDAIEEAKSSVFPEGSILVVWRSGILKHTLPVAQVNREFTVNQDLKVFKPKSDGILTQFVKYFLKTFSIDIRKKCVKSGTTVESIDTEVFLSHPIFVPPIEYQRQLIKIGADLDSLIFTSSLQMQVSLQLRSKLLYSLLSLTFRLIPS
jgi:type I restriction enzyme S subunit